SRAMRVLAVEAPRLVRALGIKETRLGEGGVAGVLVGPRTCHCMFATIEPTVIPAACCKGAHRVERAQPAADRRGHSQSSDGRRESRESYKQLPVQDVQRLGY